MKIIYLNSDGATCIVNPVSQKDYATVVPEIASMTPLEYVEFIKNKDVPIDATNVSIVSADLIPVDLTFRDALKPDLTHDKQKCVEITNDRLRNERSTLLGSLDVEFMLALEKGLPTQSIATEKQRLRDITKLANPSMTLEELKALSVNA